jgi:hypothetical protein
MRPEEIDRVFAEDAGAPGRDHNWSTPEGDLVYLVYYLGHPGYPENARSVDELRACRAAKFKTPGGQIVEVRLRPTKARPAIQTIIKTPRGTGWTYVGSLVVPFRDFGFVIQSVCDERGMTGLRETMVMYLKNTAPESPKVPEADPACPPWDPDNQRFDGLFPDHPLSRLRRIFQRVSDSAEIDAATLQLPGFPLPESGG